MTPARAAIRSAEKNPDTRSAEFTPADLDFEAFAGGLRLHEAAAVCCAGMSDFRGEALARARYRSVRCSFSACCKSDLPQDKGSLGLTKVSSCDRHVTPPDRTNMNQSRLFKAAQRSDCKRKSSDYQGFRCAAMKSYAHLRKLLAHIKTAFEPTLLPGGAVQISPNWLGFTPSDRDRAFVVILAATGDGNGRCLMDPRMNQRSSSLAGAILMTPGVSFRG